MFFSKLTIGERLAITVSDGKKNVTLRIQRATESELVFSLAGRMRSDQVPALREFLRSEAPDHNLVLDLRELKLVDRDSVRFLAQIEAEGARLRNCSAFIREWILQERNGMQRNEAECPEV